MKVLRRRAAGLGSTSPVVRRTGGGMMGLGPVRTSGGLDALGPGDCAIGAWGARTLGGVFPEALRRAALLNVLGGDDETRGT